MKNKWVISFLCLNLVLAVSFSYAQSDTIAAGIPDSAGIKMLQDYNDMLIELEQQRVSDSTQKADLQNQLSSLKTTDNLKKEELLNQLKELSSKDELRIAAKRAQIDSLRGTAKSYPVMGFFEDTLFAVYSKLGSFSVHDRAKTVSKRIKSLKSYYKFHTDSIKILESENTIDLVVGESIIMSISENDAIWNNTTRIALSQNYKIVIGKAVEKYQSETQFSTIAKNIALTLLVLLILGIVNYYLGKLFKWTAKKISEQQDKGITGIKIRDYTLFDARHQVDLLLKINTVLKWILILFALYIALPIIFGIFPWTKNFANVLFGYVLNPVKKIAFGFWDYLPNLITIIVVIVVFRYLLKGLSFLKSEIAKGNLHIPGFYADWANPTFQIVRIIVFAFMIVVIFPYLPGSDSPIFKGVSVFLGFLFTFGSAGSLSNIVAGLVLTYMRLFKIGDRVKIGEVFGDVIEKSLLVTRVRTTKNEIISIPNSTVMNSHTINYSIEAADNGLILYTTVTIGYDVPWRNIHQALINAADRTDLLLKDPKPFVLQTSLDDFYVSYQINAYTKTSRKQATIYSDLHCNIQDCCNEAGIEILSPHYRSARDGNMTTIPANYLNKEYKAPSFKVDVNSKKPE